MLKIKKIDCIIIFICRPIMVCKFYLIPCACTQKIPNGSNNITSKGQESPKETHVVKVTESTSPPTFEFYCFHYQADPPHDSQDQIKTKQNRSVHLWLFKCYSVAIKQKLISRMNDRYHRLLKK